MSNKKARLRPKGQSKTGMGDGMGNRCGEGLLNTLNFRREHQFIG
jgi:hypothetical protein